MHPTTRLLSIAALCALTAACASSGRGGPGGPGGPGGHAGQGPGPGAASGVNAPSSLLARARAAQAREGCDKAAPAYRVVAGFGEGYEIAQTELGVCLLEMAGASDAETKLFRQEGVFWLSRAAWSGDARAQGKLAEALSGAERFAVAGLDPDPQAAMMWSIVYAENGARETYGLKPLSPLVAGHLASALTPDAAVQAKKDAAAFSKISMRAFRPSAEPETGEQVLRPLPEVRRRR